MESKLLLEIHNKNDVRLTCLTISLLNLAEQFKRFLEKNGIDSHDVNDSLYIKSIKSGSIIIELAPFAPAILPLIQDFNAISEFVSYMKKSFDYFLGKENNPPLEYDKKDLQQLKECVGTVANDPGCLMSFTATEGSVQHISLTIGHIEANALQNKLSKEIENFNEEKQSKYTKQLLTWYQARFEKESSTGDKAIIENISKKPITVIFENDRIKQEIIVTTGFQNPWQKLAYIVDVEVLYLNNNAKRYKILNFYPEQTFDPEKENYEMSC